MFKKSIVMDENTMATRKIYLLINLGTPESSTPQAVSRFLKQFLSDPLVIDIPTPFRWFLVHILIALRRSKKMAKAYKNIWTDRGSPLRYHTEDLARALQAQVGKEAEVRWAMRYGTPSVEDVLKDISDQEVKVLPLYPQYALSSTQSSVNELKTVVRNLRLKNKIEFLPYFYQYDEFISSCENVFRKHAPDHWDHVLFSFHGLPVRHLTRLAPKGSDCSVKTNCCESIHSSNQYCYRAQACHSAHRIAKKLGLTRDKYSIAFQSRLGRAEWIKPYTDTWLGEAASRGIKNVIVICPSFVVDCLETLEEIQIRECENFKKRGGESLILIPCVNSEAHWVKAIESLFTQHDEDWICLGDE